MFAHNATDLDSNGQSGSCINSRMLQAELGDIFRSDVKIRCPCEITLPTESMILCEDPQCHVLQHVGCVIISERTMATLPPVPPQFYCEICRIKRADPFWVTVAHPLYPVKMATLHGENPAQLVEKLFHLTRADIALLQKIEYDAQVWCILLNDGVPFRMHWPLNADLRVNGIAVRIVNRPASQLLGANGRDDGPLIKAFVIDGVNRISLAQRDSRTFCFGVRIVKRRTVQQILNQILKQPDGEKFEDALARVRRCLGGGGELEDADSDSDLEVVADLVPVTVRCPISGSRIKVAGRFKPCAHLGCFDLETFVELNQLARKWQCPICLKNYSLENLIIDLYFNSITTMLQYCEEEITEVEVKPDGSWRAKCEDESKGLDQWHLPDGTLCVTSNKANIKLGHSSQIEHESVSEVCTASMLETKENWNRCQGIDKSGGMHTLSSANILQGKFHNLSEDFVLMSSSPTLNGRDGEDLRVNEEGDVYFHVSANKYNEHKEKADIIILSDSDEENGNLICTATVYESDQADASRTSCNISHSGVSNSFPEDPAFSNGKSSCTSLLKHSGNGGSLEMPHCALPSLALGGSRFQGFGSEENVSDTDMLHSSIAYPLPVNGYPFSPYRAVGSPTQISYSSHCSKYKISDTLLDNQLPFHGDDPPLQTSPPTACTSGHLYLKDQPGKSNALCTNDWHSVSLGSRVCGGVDLGHSAAENVSGNHFASVEVGMDSSNTASTSKVNDGIFDRTARNMKIDNTSICFPKGDPPLYHQPFPPQSVRPCFNRLTTNMDGDMTKTMLPLRSTVSHVAGNLLPTFHNDVPNIRMNMEDSELSENSSHLSTDQVGYHIPGYYGCLP